MARLSKLCVLLMSALMGVNANKALPSFNVQQTKQAHDALLQALSSDASSSLSSIAAERSARLQELMLSHPNEALKMSENLFASHSSHSQLASLQAEGHVESSFTSQSDLMYVCGQQYDDDSNKKVKYFCEETVFRHDVQKSFYVHVADNFPLIPERSHENVLLSGYQLNNKVVLKHSEHLERTPDYLPGAIPNFNVKSVNLVNGVATTINNAILYINVDFSDLPGAPATDQQNTDIVTNTNAFFKESSYGLSTVSAVFTPTLRLPLTTTQYGTDYNKIKVDSDAAAAAWLTRTGQGTLRDYPLVVWQFKKLAAFGWAGLGSVGARGTWNNGNVAGDFATKVICHELGHNYGMMHAAAWKVSL